MTVIVKNGRVLLQSLCMQICDLEAASNDSLVKPDWDAWREAVSPTATHHTTQERYTRRNAP